MALNYIWIAFFLIGFLFALAQLIFNGDSTVFKQLMDAAFSSAKTGFETSLGLTGVLTLWMGLMKVGEEGGVIKVLTRLIGPFFAKLFPSLPKDSPAHGSIMLNVAANMLGLDNAATPMGLKAMEEMQVENPHKERASDAQIMFLVLNASGLTIIPVTIMVYRAQAGAANPADIFIPILIATFCSNLAGLISVSIAQKINLFNRVALAYIGGIIAFIVGIVYYFSTLSQENVTTISNFASSFIIMSIITSFIILAMIKRVNVYETFIEGAKEGFKTAVKIIPYLVAMLVAIGIFRASGAMDILVRGIAWVFASLGFDTRFVDALPTALMKPLSGSGSRTMMIDSMRIFGPDSFTGHLACTFQGTSDTTFYIIAVYFGSVGIKDTRYAIVCGLIADFVGAVAAIFMAYLFFGG
jgi:spore maturation protein SpmA